MLTLPKRLMSYSSIALTAVFLTAATVPMTGCSLFVRDGTSDEDHARMRTRLKAVTVLAAELLMTQHPDVVPVVAQVSKVIKDMLSNRASMPYAEMRRMIEGVLVNYDMSPLVRVLVSNMIMAGMDELHHIVVDEKLNEFDIVLYGRWVARWINDIAMVHMTRE